MPGRVTHSESGATFVEAVVALAILGLIAITFLGGLAGTFRAASLASEQAIAGSLAQSQMEWVQNAAYVYGATQYAAAPLPVGKDYVAYSATIAAVPLHNPDEGIQKITVAVARSGTQAMKLEGYKVDR
ncbi:MAG: type II secretion system protein [Chloroflexota bacterium]